MNPSQEFLVFLEKAWPELALDLRIKVGRFFELVLAENDVQNLTRLISPKDFLEGHVLDCRELLKSELLEFPAMDLGSGAGVPGLLCALIRPDSWLLVESEGKKAEFLSKSVKALGLSNVKVFAERGETVLKRERVGSVVARAVGPISRIYGWIQGCSTWNSLVLLKGPKWDQEWADFQAEKNLSRGMSLSGTHVYEVGEERKQRVIARISRVPRRTT